MKRFILLLALVPMLLNAQERIMVIADPHVMVSSLHDNGKAYTDMMAQQRKMLDLSEVTWNEMMTFIQINQPDLLLIPGDLTKDGEVVCHNKVRSDLVALNNQGIKTLVIPGNHDIGGTAYQYLGDEKQPVATLANNDWWMYYDSVCSGLIAKEPNSHSFVAEPFEGLTVLGIDGAHNNAGTGSLSSQTLAWLLAQADSASMNGHMIIAMCHWQLLEHFDKQGSLESSCRLKDADAVRDSLMQHGVHVVLTGHFHVNGITKFINENDSLVEITTGAPITFPCPYRWLTVSQDRKNLSVETYNIASLPNIANLYTYSREWMAVHAHDMIAQMAPRVWSKLDEAKSKLIALGIPQTAVDQLVDCIPATEEERVALVDKHIGSTVVNLYLLHSDANEPDHREADSLAQAMYTGMDNMIEEVLSAKPALKFVLGSTIKDVAKAYVKEPLQSLVEDKTQWASASPDLTDDLRLLLKVGDGYEPQSIENTSADDQVQKILHDGQLLIIRGEKVYTVQGQQVK